MGSDKDINATQRNMFNYT